MSNLEILRNEYPELYHNVRFQTINDPLFKEWLETIDMEYMLGRLRHLDEIPVPNQLNLITIMHENDESLINSMQYKPSRSFIAIEYLANNLNWVLKRLNGR